MSQLFAVTGVTGNVGKHVAEALIAAGHRVRGIVRDESSASSLALKAKGIELFVATFSDTAALTKAFEGTDGAFIMTPPLAFSADPRQEGLEFTKVQRDATVASKVPRVVLLSSIGAHLDKGTGLILKCHDLENLFFPLASDKLSIVSLRAGYFAENTLLAISGSKNTGTYNVLLTLDKKLPVVSTKDIGAQAAQLLVEKSGPKRIVEFGGQQLLSYQQLAETFFKLSGTTLPIVAVPKENVIPIFKSMGAPDKAAESLAELFAGWDNTIAFEGGHEYAYGTQTYEEYLKEVLFQQQPQTV
jgi:uncharacterized protein YbjT (DUF2867 family)